MTAQNFTPMLTPGDPYLMLCILITLVDVVLDVYKITMAGLLYFDGPHSA